MTTVKAYYDGHVFVPQNPVSAEIYQEAIITLLDPPPVLAGNKSFLDRTNDTSVEPQSSNASRKERLLNLAGSISHNDYLEMEKALEETEKVYPNEW